MVYTMCPVFGGIHYLKFNLILVPIKSASMKYILNDFITLLSISLFVS
jgi:hypothetical protein